MCDARILIHLGSDQSDAGSKSCDAYCCHGDILRVSVRVCVCTCVCDHCCLRVYRGKLDTSLKAVLKEFVSDEGIRKWNQVDTALLSLITSSLHHLPLIVLAISCD